MSSPLICLDGKVRIWVGDCRELLSSLDDNSVDCVVTSPPYFGLRDYGLTRQIGLEITPDIYVSELVDIFRDVRRVLRKHGTLWLNIGDSYASTTKGIIGKGAKQVTNKGTLLTDRSWSIPPGCKPKDLIGIPWLVAFALRVDGWFLRQDIIWHKPAPMPESVRDRCTRAHEYLFLLSKSSKYFYNYDAISEISLHQVTADEAISGNYSTASGRGDGGRHRTGGFVTGPRRNRRSVWTIPSAPFRGEHFATFPPELAEICIKAGCRDRGVVLDPFAGAGTTGLVAARLGCTAELFELNPKYADMARQRIEMDWMGEIERLQRMSERVGDPTPLGGLFQSTK